MLTSRRITGKEKARMGNDEKGRDKNVVINLLKLVAVQSILYICNFT
jgi:hypothetical protein